MAPDGRFTWDVPAGSRVIARIVTSNTGQKLMVPTPNSSGLLIDHLDRHAAETHFRYSIDEILKTRPSLDALRYMEVDSVEVSNQTDWAESFAEEFSPGAAPRRELRGHGFALTNRHAAGRAGEAREAGALGSNLAWSKAFAGYVANQLPRQ